MVIGTIAVLMGLVLPALGSIGKASSLTSAGNQVVNILNLARANAMSRNVMTAVVLINQEVAPEDPSRGTSHRSILVMELPARPDQSPPTASDWKQMSRVEELSPGAVVDPGTAFKCMQSGSKLALPAALPAVKLRGKSVDIENCPRIVFMPNGSLHDGHTRKARLLQGYIEGETFRETASTDNYYEVIVLASSGRIKVERP